MEKYFEEYGDEVLDRLLEEQQDEEEEDRGYFFKDDDEDQVQGDLGLYGEHFKEEARKRLHEDHRSSESGVGVIIVIILVILFVWSMFAGLSSPY